MPLRLMFDFNVNPMTLGLAQIVSAVPYGPELHVPDWIAEYGGATVESCCLALRARYPDGWPHVIVYGDATGRPARQEPQEQLPDHRGHADGWTADGWARSSRSRCRRRIPRSPRARTPSTGCSRTRNGQTRLWIRKTEPRRQCPTRELVKSLQRTSKKSGTDDIEKKAGETHTHAGEALRYLVAAEFPVLKPSVAFGRARISRLL
jgi:hypothetical protein